MTRAAPIPFDPDAIAAAGGLAQAVPAGVVVAIPAEILHTPDAADLKGSSKPMSGHQKWKLSELAASVYTLLKKQGALAGETLEGFRRRIAVAACGRRISQACAGDWRAIQRGFMDAKQGHEVQRAEVVTQAATALNIARHKLWELCTLTHTPRAIAEGICRRFYKGASIADLRSARQVWAVFYTIQNNANAKAGKGSPDNRFKSKRRKSA